MPELAKQIEPEYSDLVKISMRLPQLDCPVIHRYGPGIYIREILLPAGAFVIGHHHKTESLNVFLKGRLTMILENGDTEELSAPMTFTSPVGRKCVYVHEDVVWLNVYATNEQDVETLEDMFLKKDEVFEQVKNIKLIEKFEKDRLDFKKTIKKYGFTEEIVKKISENTEDMINLPYGGYKIMVSNSDIHGKGLFATADIEKNESIAPARIGNKRTIAGRYTNHSVNPNAEMVFYKGHVDLVAIRKIKGNYGGFSGEEITIDYGKTLNKMGVLKCQV